MGPNGPEEEGGAYEYASDYHGTKRSDETGYEAIMQRRGGKARSRHTTNSGGVLVIVGVILLLTEWRRQVLARNGLRKATSPRFGLAC